MIKKIAWDTFKKTGDINTFLEFKQIENFERENTILEEIKQDKKTNENSNIINR